MWAEEEAETDSPLEAGCVLEHCSIAFFSFGQQLGSCPGAGNLKSENRGRTGTNTATQLEPGFPLN